LRLNTAKYGASTPLKGPCTPSFTNAATRRVLAMIEFTRIPRQTF
jgi:hypothetical protein